MKYGFYKIDIGVITIAEFSKIGWYRIGSGVRLELENEDFKIIEFLFDPF